MAQYTISSNFVYHKFIVAYNLEQCSPKLNVGSLESYEAQACRLLVCGSARMTTILILTRKTSAKPYNSSLTKTLYLQSALSLTFGVSS